MVMPIAMEWLMERILIFGYSNSMAHLTGQTQLILIAIIKWMELILSIGEGDDKNFQLSILNFQSIIKFQYLSVTTESL